uniref:Ubiquitin-conjugating enzyme E2 Q2 n=1 Tax=Aceria tosichella TaxID=561515 RepID=A0A6G1SE38_9ACAR
MLSIRRMFPFVALLTLAVIASLSIVQSKVNGTGGSTVSSKRLMKEFNRFQESDIYKNGVFKVQLVEDNLYEWQVEIFKVDPESRLHKDLQELKKKGKRDYIVLRLSYPDNYPLSPPLARVVYPFLEGRVLDGGAICLELLTNQGWSSAYTIEPLILQIIASLQWAYVDPNRDVDQEYTYEEAKKTYDQYLDKLKVWSPKPNH